MTDRPSPNEDIQVFIDALANGENAESFAFGQALLESYEQTIRQAKPDLEIYSRTDLLLEIFRWLLENDLDASINRLQKKELGKREFTRLSTAFWSALVFHIEVFLMHPPVSGKGLLSEAGGEFTIRLDYARPFSFRNELNIAVIKDALSYLGEAFIPRYLEGHAANLSTTIRFVH